MIETTGADGLACEERMTTLQVDWLDRRVLSLYNCTLQCRGSLLHQNRIIFLCPRSLILTKIL